MPLVGYCDKLSVRKNETIRFMVSCDLPSYKADFVRLIHGDDNPKGPGFIEHEISSIPGRECSGRRQNFEKGSYVVVPFSPVMGEIRDFTLQAWIYPTTPSKCDQGIVTDWIGSDGPGYGLFLTTEGYLSIVISDREGKS